MHVTLQLQLDANSDSAELDDSTRELLRELSTTPVENVQLVTQSDSPSHTKGFGLAAIGALAMHILDGGGLRQVADVLTAWLQRDAHRTITLTDGLRKIEVTGLSATSQRDLIESWLATSAAPTSEATSKTPVAPKRADNQLEHP
jgi:hypothetical protein